MHSTKGAGDMKRFGSEAWNGGLREGKGSVSTESRVLDTYPYTFFSRYDEKPGTTKPKELLGAVHAASFTMPFVRLLSMANFVSEQVDGKSESSSTRTAMAFPSPRSISPSPRKIPGIDQAAFGTS
jgi:osmotically inducible protein OsmC